jgi:hypothetical protein
MDKESLKKVKEFISKIDTLDIPIQDKLEILINLNTFLDPDNYYKHINILKRHTKDKKWRNK